MAISAHPTPNPNAMKFSVGTSVGSPKSADAPDGDPMTDALLGVEGVASIFMTADFVTVSKTPEAEWEAITPAVTEILGSHF